MICTNDLLIVGYDAVRFVGDFENCIEDFKLAGTYFSEEYEVTTLLYKTPQTNEPGTLYASFYHNVTIQRWTS